MVRIVTPGTLTDEALLDERRDNLLSALHQVKNTYGLASLDLNGSRFTVVQLHGEATLLNELERLKPAELLIGEDFSPPGFWRDHPGLRRQAPWHLRRSGPVRPVRSPQARQLSHGIRTDTGSRVFALLARVIATCRQRGQSPWRSLQTAIADRRTGQPRAALPQQGG